MNDLQAGSFAFAAEPSPSDEERRRICVLVLGMHRSGTSAFARVINLLGAALPQKLMPPALDNNETGFWEPERLVRLHDQMLAEAGSRWDDWRKLDLSVLPAERLASFKVEIRRLIEEEYEDAPIFVLKEPRICRFVPLYLEVLSEAGIEPRIVLATRNPLEVAASLGRRDGMGQAQAGLLWLRHVLDAEVATREMPRAIVSYDNLLEDWRAVAKRLDDRLAVSWPYAIDDVAAQVEQFLAPEQRHHARPAEDVLLDTIMRNWIGEACSSLLVLERNPAARSALSALDRIRREFSHAAPLIYGWEAELRNAHQVEANDLRAALESAKSEAEARGAALSEQQAEADDLRAALSQQQAEANDLRAALDQERKEATARTERLSIHYENEARSLGATVRDIRGEAEALKQRLSERENAFEEQTATLATLRLGTQQIREEHELAKQELSRRSALVNEMLSSTSWRLTAPLRSLKDKTTTFLHGNKPVAGTLAHTRQHALSRARDTRLASSGGRRGSSLDNPILVPANDIRPSGTENGWEATGSDPQLLLSLVTSARFLRVRFAATVTASHTGASGGKWQVFFDYGAGFCEADSYTMHFQENRVELDTIVHLREPVVALRIDPIDRPCEFIVHDFRVQARSAIRTRLEVASRRLARIRKNKLLGQRLRVAIDHLMRGRVAEVAHLLFRTEQHGDLYQDWISGRAVDGSARAKLAAEAETFTRKPVFSIVMPTYNTPREWLTKAIESVRAQVYPGWELCICDDASSDASVREILEFYRERDSRIKVVYRSVNGHIAHATNDAMALITGDYMCLMDHDDEIPPDALHEFAKALNDDPSLEFIYSDEDKISTEGVRYEPFFKPDWSPLLLESCMYTAHLAAYRMDIVRKVGGFRPECNGAQDYDFVLRFAEHVKHVCHVPRILYHWRAIPGSTALAMDNKSYVIDAALRALTDRCARTGTPALVRPGRYAGSFVTRRKIVGEPLVSIVIPSAGRDCDLRGRTLNLLVNCVANISEKSTYRRFEIIVVDNGDIAPETVSALASCNLKFVTYRAPEFNVAAKMNLGARHASGEFLLFLNDDVEVISPDWLEAMIAAAQVQGVGMVGAKLYFENGALQHVGVTTCEGWPDHVRRGFSGDDPGYFFSSVTTREVAAVTGACMLMPSSLFWRVGGFNEGFAVNYNDIDLCLKIRQTGARVIQSSQAELYHFEGRSRIREVDKRELDLWAELWSKYFAVDPYYSPIMTVSPPTYEPDFARRGNLV